MKYFRRIASEGQDINSIGGCCVLPAGEDIPRCRLCSAEMILFFQFDIPAEADLPFEAASHLSVFMCPEHNEIPSVERYRNLPEKYWEKTEGHWYASLTKPRNDEAFKESPQFLVPARLQLADSPGTENQFLKVGGAPSWLQDEEEFICSCGSSMHFVCQLSDGYEFPKLHNAPEQPDSFSHKSYVLFLGNEVYVFACSSQCDPRAVWITVQN